MDPAARIEQYEKTMAERPFGKPVRANRRVRKLENALNPLAYSRFYKRLEVGRFEDADKSEVEDAAAYYCEQHDLYDSQIKMREIGEFRSELDAFLIETLRGTASPDIRENIRRVRNHVEVGDMAKNQHDPIAQRYEFFYEWYNSLANVSQFFRDFYRGIVESNL
ncbi:MAG: hypothetical protein ABIH34_05830 [Nanoarchaeota archaeon]